MYCLHRKFRLIFFVFCSIAKSSQQLNHESMIHSLALQEEKMKEQMQLLGMPAASMPTTSAPFPPMQQMHTSYSFPPYTSAPFPPYMLH